MALRLIRQQSDTPNVTNKDDVQMVRYAYGGYNGVVKDFGEELKVEHIAGSGLFFKSGKIVLYGWEVDIDGSGYLLTIPYLSGTYYYSAYLEINAFQETAEIKAVYNPYAQHPNIDNGDDLTQIPNGLAKLLLYNFEVYNGHIITTEFEPKFKIIPYISEAFEDDRLTIKKATLADTAEYAEYARKIKSTRIGITNDTPINTIFDSFTLQSFRRYAIEFTCRLTDGKTANCLATGIAYEGVLYATSKHYFQNSVGLSTFEIVLKNANSQPQFIEARVNGQSYGGNVFDISAIYILEKIEWE